MPAPASVQVQPTSQCLDPSPGHRPIGPSAHPQPWPPLLWQLVQIASAGHLDIVEMAGYDNGVTMVTMKKTSETVTFQTYFVSLRMRLSKLE